MKKVIFFFILILPFIVKADEILSMEEKYYKTIEYNYGILTSNNHLRETVEVSREEYESASDESTRNNAWVETNYKKMTVTIEKAQSLYKYTVNLHWKNMPSTRSYDIIGLAYYASVETRLDPIFEQRYCRSTNNCYTSNTHYQIHGYSSESSLFLLPTGTLTSLDQTLFVLVGKSDPSLTIISQKAVGDYAHAQNNVSLSDAYNFEMTLSGFSLDTSILFDYDAIPTAYTTWSGTW